MEYFGFREEWFNKTKIPRPIFALSRPSRVTPEAERGEAKRPIGIKKLIQVLQNDIFGLENIMRRQIKQLRDEDTVTLSKMSAVKDKFNQLENDAEHRHSRTRTRTRSRRDEREVSFGSKFFYSELSGI